VTLKLCSADAVVLFDWPETVDLEAAPIMHRAQKQALMDLLTTLKTDTMTPHATAEDVRKVRELSLAISAGHQAGNCRYAGRYQFGVGSMMALIAPHQPDHYGRPSRARRRGEMTLMGQVIDLIDAPANYRPLSGPSRGHGPRTVAR
jgi:hypothetical protein